MDIKFCERLKECRKSRGITQQMAANFLGMTIGNYQKYESGMLEPNLSNLNKIADYYKTSTDWLLGRTDSNEHKKSTP